MELDGTAILISVDPDDQSNRGSTGINRAQAARLCSTDRYGFSGAHSSPDRLHESDDQLAGRTSQVHHSNDRTGAGHAANACD